MKKNVQKLLEKAKLTPEVVETMAKEGIRSVSGACMGMGVFRSLSALSVSDLEKDETHYLLVPVPGSKLREREFVLFSKRVIPEGYGAMNSLPKERVFHLPDLSAEAHLRKQLASSFVEEQNHEGGGKVVELADRLEKLAEEIDKETDKVSGGILLVGGVTTLLNPLAGIGILASGVLPSIGGKIAKTGASAAGEQLRGWSRERQKDKSEKDAKTKVSRLKPQVFVNPVLHKLETVLTNATGQEDPLLESGTSASDFPNQRYFLMTAEGVTEVYEGLPSEKSSPLSSAIKSWLQHFGEIAKEV